ncbi:reverse transcriptase domain-containing protein [Tanacetum coccineum]
MSFGLKNAGATYQRLVGKAFEKQVGQNLEVYVDDLVIKSHTEAELLRDIKETFRTLRKINMKLNPKKFKEVQSLNGKLAGLNRTPHVGGTKAKGIANNVLIRLPRSGWRCLDDKKGTQSRRQSILLRRYFQAHPIAVITDQLIRQVMSRPEVAGRLQKWSIILGEHNITYRPRASVKGQILADFLVKKPEEASSDMSEKEAPQEPWTLFTDGLLCIDGLGAGLILTNPEGAEFTYALSLDIRAYLDD